MRKPLTRGRILRLYAIAFSVLALAAAGSLLWERLRTASPETEPITVTAFSSNATQLSYVREGESLSLSATGDAWYMDTDDTIPVQNTIADSAANAVSHMTALRSFSPEEGVLADYGLEGEGRFTLTASNEAGDSAVLTVGSSVPDDSGYYVLYDDTVYVIDTTVVEALDKGFEDFLDLDDMPDLLPSDLILLTVNRDGHTLELGYDEGGLDFAYEQGFYWYILSPYTEPREADEKNAHSLFYDVTGLYFYGCADFRPDSYDSYGFDTPLCTVTLLWTDEAGEEITTVLLFGNETDDGYIYTRFADSDMVLLANASIAHSIAYTAAADLLPRQVCALQLSTVRTMTVETADGDTIFEGEALGSDEMTVFFEALNSLVSNVRAPDITPDDPVLTICFERNTDHDADMTLTLYSYDEAYYLAAFDGRQDQLVDIYTVDALIEQYKEIKIQS